VIYISIKDTYYIEKIDYKTAMDMIVQFHYLHRKAPCSFAFGLFERETNRIVGVIVYGCPSSACLRKGICGEEEKDNVIELTRLWIEDGTPKNTESYLIGNTLKLVNKEIIVSYAEIEQGHLGIVYQATNWIYTGMSAKHSSWTIEGEKGLHQQSLSDKYSISEIKQIYGDKFKYTERPRKHRYIYFNCNKKRKKELFKKLKYQIMPYPKNNNIIN
jgi:hypothetical protein